MKIVHVSYKDDQEGAAIAVDRICSALIAQGVDSKILVQKKITDKPYARPIAISKLQKILAIVRVGIDLLINNILVKEKSSYFTFPFIGTDISKHPLLLEADVIHLHWINRGFLSLRSIRKILELNKPVVWTLHDSWAFTGGCHMTDQCAKYQADCKGCPMAPGNQFAKRFLKMKSRLFAHPSMNFVAPSSWIADRASGSRVLGGKAITVVPNCVDTTIFKPLDPVNARKTFNLPLDKSIVLFNITRDVRKGIKYLREAIAQLEKENVNLVFVGFGSSDIENSVFADLPIITVGRINDKYSMATLYSASDVMIAPALEEPFGQTYTEAMACGTPCVAFDHSGPTDIIDHKENGYLASYANADSVVAGIHYCLSNRNKMSVAAVEKIKEEFSFESVAQMHISYYRSL